MPLFESLAFLMKDREDIPWKTYFFRRAFARGRNFKILRRAEKIQFVFSAAVRPIEAFRDCSEGRGLAHIKNGATQEGVKEEVAE
jgi:hypothetical protein